MLKVEQFTQDPYIQHLVADLKSHKKQVSDTISIHPETKEEVEYVDLVQEGGGMLGIALVGYVYVLEQMGIRFRSLAGASAGAINATLMYAIGDAHEAKSEKLLKLISDKNFFDFIDGNWFVRWCFRRITGRFKIFAYIAAPLLLVYTLTIGYLINKFGLNPGNTFKDWISDILKSQGVATVEEMEEKRSHFKHQPLQLRKERGKDDNHFSRRLVLIASDVTTQTKVEFPQYAPLYWMNANQAEIADFVRASMSIPFFFRPFQKNNIFGDSPSDAQQNLWNAFANGMFKPSFNTFDAEIVAEAVAGKRKSEQNFKEIIVPQKVKMVDGGLLSNFPISVFHSKKVSIPRMPTFGVKLGRDIKNIKETNLLLTFLGAMFATIRQLYDDDFLQKNSDYSRLITFIETDDFNWLNFNMNDADKIKLFKKGAEAAADFYKSFDWESYKAIRKDLD